MENSNISFSDFSRIDIRVGEVVKVEEVTGSANLFRLYVDFGKDLGERTIMTGLKKWYKKEDLEGKKFIFVTNLEPKKMMGETSNGMMLCAVESDDKIFLTPVGRKIKTGTIVR